MSGGDVWRAVCVLLVLVLIVVIIVLPKDTEDCRIAALDDMCGYYGNTTGGAAQVLGGNGGFWVECGEGVKWNVSP